MKNSSECAFASFSVVRLNSSIYPNDALKGGASGACIVYNRPLTTQLCVYALCMHCALWIHTNYTHTKHCIHYDIYCQISYQYFVHMTGNILHIKRFHGTIMRYNAHRYNAHRTSHSEEFSVLQFALSTLFTLQCIHCPACLWLYFSFKSSANV